MKITSIFLSVEGEVNYHRQGDWTVFIRFAGCSAKCNYCDTRYSWSGGEEMSANEIVSQVERLAEGIIKVKLTGGEVFEQDGPAFRSLISRLVRRGFHISIETNGLYDVVGWVDDIWDNGDSPKTFEEQISFVVDYKLPSAGAVSEKMNLQYFKRLSNKDTIKFVISDRKDFDCAMSVVNDLWDVTLAEVYFSPCIDKIHPKTLFEWMKNSKCPRYNVGYNLQIHKFIFSSDWRAEEK